MSVFRPKKIESLFRYFMEQLLFYHCLHIFIDRNGRVCKDRSYKSIVADIHSRYPGLCKKFIYPAVALCGIKHCIAFFGPMFLSRIFAFLAAY